VLKPRVDPCIFLHGNVEDWVALLGYGFVRELVRRFRHVAVDIDHVARYILENPGVASIGLKGLEVGGPYRREWRLFVESEYIDPGARARWPYVSNDELLDVRLQVSPCFLLASPTRDVGSVWRSRAASLFRWVSALPRHNPLEVFREAFPLWLRELGRSRGYAWVAWTRWRDRRNRHLAEWLYWLDTGRIPHIDAVRGRIDAVYETADRTKKSAAESLYVSS